MVAVALGIGLILQRYLGISVIALVFLTAVLTSAITYGLWPALAASLVSTLAYNFFFLPPLYTFTISDPQNVVALFFFAIVALIASNLTARMRSQALAARQRAKTTEDLYLFSRKLGGAVTLDDLLWATSYQIALMLKVTVVILLPEEGTVAVRSGYPPEDALDEADLAAAKWCWQNDREAGRGPTPCRAPSACSCPSAPAAGPSGWWAWGASGKAPCSHPINAACSTRSAIRQLSPLSARRCP
jgi:Osmosensitive K+ channel histidine kinase